MACLRAYISTDVETCRKIWEDGFWDMHSEVGLVGVCLFDEPDPNPMDTNCEQGEGVILAIEIPESVFEQYEIHDSVVKYREAIVPASELNTLGKPKVYDHDFAGASRKEMLKSADFWQQGVDVQSFQYGNAHISAIKFFDEIGWLTPLKVQEQGGLDAP